MCMILQHFNVFYTLKWSRTVWRCVTEWICTCLLRILYRLAAAPPSTLQMGLPKAHVSQCIDIKRGPWERGRLWKQNWRHNLKVNGMGGLSHQSHRSVSSSNWALQKESITPPANGTVLESKHKQSQIKENSTPSCKYRNIMQSMQRF